MERRRRYKTLESHYFNKTLQEKAILKMADLNNTTFVNQGMELFRCKLQNELVGLTLNEWRNMNECLNILKSI